MSRLFHAIVVMGAGVSVSGCGAISARAATNKMPRAEGWEAVER